MIENPSPKGAGEQEELFSHTLYRKKGPTPPEELVEAMNHAFHQIYPKVSKDLTQSQITIIWNILKGKDTINILPTGSGKSACYLVAGMLLDGLTVIITPLLSLMRDQVEKLHGQIPTACLSSTLIADRDAFYEFSPLPIAEEEESISRRKLRNRIFRQISEEALWDGKDRYRFLYVTPERLINGHFYRFAKRAPIRLVAVDEAHCISLWGYEFRPSYLKIPLFLKRLSSRPILAAFTATATLAVRKDILDFLDMKNVQFYPPRDGGIPSLKVRENLSFFVEEVKGKDREDMEKNRLSKVIKLCKNGELSKGSGIIYCATVSQVRYYYESMKKAGLSVAQYYANLDKDKGKDKDHLIEMGKKESWEAFLNGKIKVMVATNAMGMGVDKGDISFVLHVGMPLCLENYYQEAGRAGRDGAKATCLLLYSRYDRGTCETLLEKSLQMSDLTEPQKDVREAIVMNRLNCMEEYCKHALEYQEDDLQEYIRDYFISGEEQWNAQDEKADKEEEKGGNLSRIQESSQKIRKELLKKRYSPDVLYVNRTLLASSLHMGKLSDTVNLEGHGATSKEHLISYEISEALSYQDLMVADAVYTLLYFKKKAIYASHVIQLLSGNLDLTIKTDRKEEVYASIEKMTRTTIKIDLSQVHSYGFSYSDQKKALWEGPFLPLTRAKQEYFVSDGTIPPLYELAEILNGQFYTFPLRLLQVKKYPSLGRDFFLGQDPMEDEAFLDLKPEGTLHTSWDNLILTHFLLSRIDVIRSTNLSRNIKFTSILQTLDGLGRDKRYKESVLEDTETVLTHLLHEKYISCYHLEDTSPLEKISIQLDVPIRNRGMR